MAAQTQTRVQAFKCHGRLPLAALLRKQPMMRRVLISLLPIILFSVYLFGWRVLSVLAVVTAAGVLTEHFVEKTRKGKPTESVLVSCFLLTLILPATIPYWQAVVGIVFALIFGKQVFGGFGRNVFNPAVLGRVFLFLTFPGSMTNAWAQPFSGFPGGFARWISVIPDGVSRATPLFLSSQGEMPYTHLQLFLGTVPGSMGETSALLILLAGAYLIYRKTASWKTMVSVLAGVLLMQSVFHFTGNSLFPDPIYAILSGGALFGAVFMATDPISAPSTDNTKYVYGLLIGSLAVIMRELSIFPEGMMFAILMVNAFVPLMDIAAKSMKRRAAA